MKARISFITLGVDDLDRAVQFYREGLGLETAGIVGVDSEQGAVAFFKMQPGLTLALWPRRHFAHDMQLPQGPRSATECALASNVATKDEVDLVINQAISAGACLVKAPSSTLWGGYAGFFQDPDGHIWEIVWNPTMQVFDEQG